MDLAGKKIVIVATDYFEEVELTDPLERLTDMEASVEVAAPHEGTIQALRGVEQGREIKVDKLIKELNPLEYDAVIIPGGVVNSDHLRTDKDAQEFVQSMADAGKPVAAICHGPWLLVSSGLVEGKTITSNLTLADDIRNAGGNWVNREVAVDGELITSRNPDDLPAFIQMIAESISKSSEE